MLIDLLILFVFLFILVFSISRWKIHPFIALILVAMALGISMGLGGQRTTEVLLTGFSETLRWIALIIILGSFIGEVLQHTGGAFRIAERIVKWVGTRKLPWAMGATGYLVSIPVFVDVAYILLHPVVESLAVKSKKPVLYIGLALAAGLTVSHTLIPPTPGPMAVASLLHVDIGRMMLINIVVGIFAMAGGVIWSLIFFKSAWIPYDKKLSDLHEKDKIETKDPSEFARKNALIDLLPILLPIVLIGGGALGDLKSDDGISKILNFLSTPLVAVLVGAFVAALQIRNKSSLNSLVESAILKSALVIMITGAGGSLGFVIRESGIQDQIIQFFSDFPFLGFMLPFLVASLLTIATGSITVSLVGTASMLGPMVGSLPVSPELAAALIGCGAFCVFHANSSFFWLLNRLHEVPPTTLYKTYTVQSLVMGCSGLAGVFILRSAGL